MQRVIIGGWAIVIAAFAALAAIGGATMKITSSAFSEGGTIPDKYAKAGQNVNPPLRIEGTPADAKSLLLIMDDPDAPVGLFQRRGAGYERLSGLRLRWPAAALGHASLLFQSVRARSDARSQAWREAQGSGRSDAGARYRSRRIDGPLLAQEIIEACRAAVAPKLRHDGTYPSSPFE